MFCSKKPLSVNDVIVSLTNMVDDLQSVAERQDAIEDSERDTAALAIAAADAAATESARASTIASKIESLIS